VKYRHGPARPGYLLTHLNELADGPVELFSAADQDRVFMSRQFQNGRAAQAWFQ
jgi:hypothetical protein